MAICCRHPLSWLRLDTIECHEYFMLPPIFLVTFRCRDCSVSWQIVCDKYFMMWPLIPWLYVVWLNRLSWQIHSIIIHYQDCFLSFKISSHKHFMWTLCTVMTLLFLNSIVWHGHFMLTWSTCLTFFGLESVMWNDHFMFAPSTAMGIVYIGSVVCYEKFLLISSMSLNNCISRTLHVNIIHYSDGCCPL